MFLLQVYTTFLLLLLTVFSRQLASIPLLLLQLAFSTLPLLWLSSKTMFLLKLAMFLQQLAMFLPQLTYTPLLLLLLTMFL